MNIPSEPWLEVAIESIMPEVKDLAADIGANRGEWSQAMANKFLSVVAVEPDPRAYEQIAESPRITVAPFAIGEKTGMATFHLRPMPEQNSLLEIHPVGGPDVVSSAPVAVSSMDDLFPGGCDFVKIDIEGGEVAALRGCVNLESWTRTSFLVECHDTFAEVANELQRLGKRVTRIPHPLAGAHPGHCWAAAK